MFGVTEVRSSPHGARLGTSRVSASLRLDSAEEHATPTRSGGREVRYIDAIRGLAALGIVVYHAASEGNLGINGAWRAVAANLNVGVALFFVLSGYLLYRPFVRARAVGSSGPNRRDFYRNRAMRIFPAYWVALTALSALGLVTLTVSTAVPDYLLLQVWDQRMGAITPAWTLCNEVAFYAVLPFAAAWLGRPKRVRWEIFLLAAVIALSLALRLATQVAESRGLQVGGLVLTPFLNADLFAAGMVLAVVEQRRGDQPTGIPRRACWLAALATFAALAIVRPAPEPNVLLVDYAARLAWLVIAVLVLAPAALGPGRAGAARDGVVLRCLSWLGLVSYGVYLWHLPVNRWLEGRRGGLSNGVFVGVCVLVAVALGAASYYLIERHVLLRKRPAV